MDLYLQVGHGMMEHCRHLLGVWGGGTAILSPRDLDDRQLHTLSDQLRALPGGQVLLDPQFFLPHADHVRLRSHAFWPDAYETASFFEGSALRDLISKLVDLNTGLGTAGLILPGLLAVGIDDDWVHTQNSILDVGRELGGDRQVLMTIALNADTTRDQDQIAALLEVASSWKADGFYVVFEHPGGDYLVQDPNWLANVLDLVAGLRLTGAIVVVGYCNHQMLATSVAGANALCSGTWMNVRSFPPDKFRTAYDDEIRRRSTWYYCPQSQSEYKIPFLDIAQRRGVLNEMAPSPALDGGYVRGLFEGPQPSTIDFSEQPAFRHYLYALRGQAQSVARDTYDEALAAQSELLDRAEVLLSKLTEKGVRGQLRDFSECVDVNRAALATLDSIRGPVLRRRWNDLRNGF